MVADIPRRALKLILFIATADLYSTSIANPSLGKASIGTPEAQAASNSDDEHSSGFGCGSIDIKGGGPATLLLLLLLPVILKGWRRLQPVSIWR